MRMLWRAEQVAEPCSLVIGDVRNMNFCVSGRTDTDLQGGVVTELMRDLLCCRAILEVRPMRDVSAYRQAELLPSRNRAPHLLQRPFANRSNITNNCKTRAFTLHVRSGTITTRATVTLIGR